MVLAGQAIDEAPVAYKSKVWAAKLPGASSARPRAAPGLTAPRTGAVPPKRKGLSLPPPQLGGSGGAVALDPFKLAGTKVLREGGEDEEEESRHKKAKTEPGGKSGLLGLLPAAKGGGGGARRAQPKAKRSAAEAQAAYEATAFPAAGPREESALRDEQLAAGHDDSTSKAFEESTAAASAVRAQAASAASAGGFGSSMGLGGGGGGGGGAAGRLGGGFSVPGINATPDVAAKAPAANPEYRPPPFGQQQAPPHLPDSLTRQSQQQQQQAPPPPAFGGISEEMLAGMSKHERALLSANAGNIVDVNAAQMKAGAEAWVQPGGEGFVSDFAGKASKPSGRSKSKHQITSLVYDLAQKEV